LLDPLAAAKGKWSELNMAFIEGLPKSQGKDVILVVVDRLKNYLNFIPLTHYSEGCPHVHAKHLKITWTTHFHRHWQR
jgi:hypothetical protein